MRWCQEGQTKHEWLFLHEMGKVRLHLPVPVPLYIYHFPNKIFASKRTVRSQPYALVFVFFEFVFFVFFDSRYYLPYRALIIGHSHGANY